MKVDKTNFFGIENHQIIIINQIANLLRFTDILINGIKLFKNMIERLQGISLKSRDLFFFNRHVIKPSINLGFM